MNPLRPSQLSTGIREVDADMEGLCFLLGRIFDPGVECRRRFGGCDRRRCTRLQALLRFVQGHFRRQEKWMGGSRLQDAAHRREHAQLEAKLIQMIADDVCGDRDAAMVREVVIRWMGDHSRRCDRHLSLWADHRQDDVLE